MINLGYVNDSITLGANADNNVIIYNLGDGNNTIYGFNDNDTLSIASGTYATKKSGDNVVVTVGEGKITLIGASSNYLLNIEGTPSETALKKVTNSDLATVSATSNVVTIDETARTKAVKVKGNENNNSIVGGSDKDTIWGGIGDDKLLGNGGNDSLYGGDGKDTLDGGADSDKLVGGTGKDSLWGDEGADVFYYAKGDGKNIIYGFDSKDTLTIDNLKFTSSYTASGGIVLTVDSGSITLKDFTTSTFHINSDTYKISGSKFVKK